jgi:mRNA interferase MazF
MAGGVSFPLRGEIYRAALDPVVGTEIAKTRPALIISNDVQNELSPRVIVAAITSQGIGRVYPFEVLIPVGEGSLPQTSKVLLSQIRSIDKRRLGGRVGALPPNRMKAVDEAIRTSLAV